MFGTAQAAGDAQTRTLAGETSAVFPPISTAAIFALPACVKTWTEGAACGDPILLGAALPRIFSRRRLTFARAVRQHGALGGGRGLLTPTEPGILQRCPVGDPVR